MKEKETLLSSSFSSRLGDVLTAMSLLYSPVDTLVTNSSERCQSTSSIIHHFGREVAFSTAMSLHLDPDNQHQNTIEASKPGLEGRIETLLQRG